jgi:hypothetical protein
MTPAFFGCCSPYTEASKNDKAATVYTICYLFAQF